MKPEEWENGWGKEEVTIIETEVRELRGKSTTKHLRRKYSEERKY